MAVVIWDPDQDELSQVICDELRALGHQPLQFIQGNPIPANVEVVFTFAPYGRLLPIFQRVARQPRAQRPVVVHWNTEGMPDLRLPWTLVRSLSAGRSWLDRAQDQERPLSKGMKTIQKKLTDPLETRVLRYRYIGDYYYAYRKGWLDVFADSSAVYAALHNQHGLPTLVAPWGGTSRWYADLGLERDIDVLWMGQRGSGRRGKLVGQIRQSLKAHGVDIYMVDNEENPFVFGDERTEILNRAKITLNLTRTWYDDNFSRFAMAAPNRSLIISEPMLPHCPQWRAGTHYVSAPIDSLADTILHYLHHDDERRHLVNSAYRLATTELAFGNSIRTIMQAVYHGAATNGRANQRPRELSRGTAKN